MRRAQTDFLVLALDIGSSSTRTALCDSRGARLPGSAASEPYEIRYTPDGGAELHPAELLRATRQCVAQTLGAENAHKLPIAAVTGCGFWHSLFGLDARSRPATPIYTWADTRAAADAERLRTEFDERALLQRTGCMLRAPYWSAKLRWLSRTEPALFRRVTYWVSPARWIFREIFGADGTSHSMASGTGLYNLKARGWDAELIAACGVREEQLGPIKDAPVSSARNSLVPAAQVFAAIGDGAASNLGSGADRAGLVAVNVGTSAAVRTLSDAKLRNRTPFGLFRHVVDEGRVAIGGAISNAGNLRAWCMREFDLADDRALARAAAASDRLVALPYLVSERAPTWPENVAATFTGLTSRTTRNEVFRAAITASYYRLAAILDLLERHGPSVVEQVIVSGGVLKSARSLALLADCLGRDLHICTEPESSLRGAAVHALRKLGADIKPLTAGRVVRHRQDLTEKHRLRRADQASLERAMLSLRPRAARSPRPGGKRSSD